MKLFDLLTWFKNHDEELHKDEWDKKNEELGCLLREVDRIHIREYVDNNAANLMELFIKLDNELVAKDDPCEIAEFARDSGLVSAGAFGFSLFMLVPPFVKQGVKIPNRIRELYAESRYCFVFEQYSAAIVLSRAIIETVLKNKLGLSEDDRYWTAGRTLEKAKEKKLVIDKAFWVAKKVTKKADNILHRARKTDYKEAKNALNHTKEFLEDLFG